jgi:hypothetical protein
LSVRKRLQDSQNNIFFVDNKESVQETERIWQGALVQKFHQLG